MSDSEDLASRISAFLTARRVRFEPKRMMGGLVFMVNVKMTVSPLKVMLCRIMSPSLLWRWM